MSNFKLVYSTDPKDKIPSDKDGELLKNETVNEEKITIVFRLEKSGRGGKTVTVMDAWPRNEDYLKVMTKELKAKCGTGGTYLITEKSGIIEIQGDKREALKKVLAAKNIKFKGM